MPGDRDHPEWWTDRDESILAGELSKLQGLPRPIYTERKLHELRYVPIGARVRRLRIRAMVQVVVLCVLLAVLAVMLVQMLVPAAGPGAPYPAPSVYGTPAGGAR